MHHCFVDTNDICENNIIIKDEELRHIRDVLHFKIGELISVSDKIGNIYICKLENISKNEAIFQIIEKKESKQELQADIVLFQALPKSDKMELIIQKSVELGVNKIIPIITKRCIVKLDKDKINKKTKRWQEISKAAAKQAKRGIIPEVLSAIDFKTALEQSKNYENKFLAYENSFGVKNTLNLISKIKPKQKIAIFIGPEGGFEDEEILSAKNFEVEILSLGKRILRTESAAFCLISNIMFHLEALNE